MALVFARFRYPGSWGGLGLRGARPGWWAAGLGGGAVAALLAWAVGVGVERWGWPTPVHPVEPVLRGAEGPGDVLAILVAVAVVVPVAEEAFFRGFAYRLLRARLGVGAAIVASGLAFALVHGLEVGAWLPVLPVGLVLAVLAERSGSLGPPIAGHAVVNALAVLTGRGPDTYR